MTIQVLLEYTGFLPYEWKLFLYSCYQIQNQSPDSHEMGEDLPHCGKHYLEQAQQLT